MKSNAKKYVLIGVGIVVLLAVIAVVGAIIWYKVNIGAVQKDEGQTIRVEIEEGSGTLVIADLLEQNNVIKSANAMKVFVKLNKISNLQAGKYDLNNSEDLQNILLHIQNGEVVNEEVKITFVEGKNMRSIAKAIAQNTVNTEEDVFNLLEDDEYIDSLIEKYWFLTDDIKNEDIYYPLEGYLLPDTYIFENDQVSVKTIFNVMLNYMDNFLTEHKDEIKYNIHELMTLASITELEGVSDEDRKEIVGVLINRLHSGMSLGSDVTTYYAFKVDMGERDLYAKELNTENPYNTRGPNMGGKLPVGPICNPSKNAIIDTLNYTETDNLYFVADKNKKVYFTKTNEEHNNLIKQLKENGLWYEYN